MLEHLRRDRDEFNQKYLGLYDQSYDELKEDFLDRIPDIVKIVNASLDQRQIGKDLTEYLDSVIKENF